MPRRGKRGGSLKPVGFRTKKRSSPNAWIKQIKQIAKKNKITLKEAMQMAKQ